MKRQKAKKIHPNDPALQAQLIELAAFWSENGPLYEEIKYRAQRGLPVGAEDVSFLIDLIEAMKGQRKEGRQRGAEAQVRKSSEGARRLDKLVKKHNLQLSLSPKQLSLRLSEKGENPPSIPTIRKYLKALKGKKP